MKGTQTQFNQNKFIVIPSGRIWKCTPTGRRLNCLDKITAVFDINVLKREFGENNHFFIKRAEVKIVLGSKIIFYCSTSR